MTAEELRQLADELEQAGRARAEVSDGPCEDHDGVDCHAAAALTAWSRAARLVRQRADELPDSITQWGYRTPWGSNVGHRSEESAHAIVAGTYPYARAVIRREVGPWTEVQP
jgi:hypothetical protein